MHINAVTYYAMIATLASASLPLDYEMAVAQTGSNRQFSAAVRTIHSNKSRITAQINLENVSKSGQYIAYCALTAEVNASLSDGTTLTLDSGSVSGIPSSYGSTTKACINGKALDDMMYLEPASSTVVSLTWYDHTGNDIPTDNLITFPFILIVRTVPSGAAGSNPGPFHAVMVSVPPKSLKELE